MKKILFFSISSHHHHIFFRNMGCYKLAHELRNHGFECQVIEFLHDFTDEQFNQIMERVVPHYDMIALSTTYSFIWMEYGAFPQQCYSRFEQIYKSAKEQNKKLVFGGSHVDKFVPRFPDADAFFEGYSEQTFVNYCKQVFNTNPLAIFTPLPENRIFKDQSETVGYDFASSSMSYTDQDIIFPKETLSIEISRGCIFKCKYCSFPMNGKKKNDFIRNADSIYEEMMENYRLYGSTRYFFLDNTFNDTVEKMEIVRDAVQRLPFKDELEICGYIRHDLLARDFDRQIKLLQEIGFRHMQYGIEVLNDESGKLIGKGMPFEETLAFLRKMKQHREETGEYFYQFSAFMMGFEYDNIPEFKERLTLLLDEDLLDGVALIPLVVDATTSYKSEFEENLGTYGFVIDPVSMNWSNDRNPEGLKNFAEARATVSEVYSEIVVPRKKNLPVPNRKLYVKSMMSIATNLSKSVIDSIAETPNAEKTDLLLSMYAKIKNDFFDRLMKLPLHQ